MIKISNLVKEYDSGLVALNSINLTVNKGEFVYVVGPSGSGKSTLLRCVFRSEIPSSGSVYIDNYSLADLKQKQIAYLRRNIGMIFQDFKLLKLRNVFDNIAFALHILGYTRSSIRKRVHQVLELVGLLDKWDQFPSQLSGGEQQRICIARAIVNNPPILLADEPTGSLDPDTSWEIMQLLSKINKRKTTILVATHNKGIVDDLRKRVVALEYGRIVRDKQLGAYDA
ncbi:cell division ATP-binding protein FtsE [Candidatus Marinamargulisbacteria bacterium SCGC AG-343-D04]|nr:cell division ATP-binding protein FtsE [Candidatus Marinamargulisbacteria bacterium SCGC AG-343-D04]